MYLGGNFLFVRCLNLKALFASLTYVSCLLPFSFSDSFVVHNITFDLISNTFKPFTKLGNPPQSVNRVDKPVTIQTFNAVYNCFNPQRYHTKKALKRAATIKLHFDPQLKRKKIQEEKMSLGTTNTPAPK